MASSFSITMENNNVDEVISAMRSQVFQALETIGQEAEGFAKDDCP